MASILEKSLLNLPRELHHYIFNYLDIQTILCSVRLVCKELYTAAETYDRLRLNFFSTSTSKQRCIANIVQTKNIISLVLSNKDQTELSKHVDLFFSLYQLDQFTRLQSMTLVEINNILFDQCLEHIIRIRLTSLSITLRQQTPTETDRIIRLISSTIARFSLPNLILNIDNAQIIIDDQFRPIHNALRHLTVGNCTQQDYQRILCNCTGLRKFVVGNYVISDTRIMRMTSVLISYSQLTSLALYRWSSSIDQLDLLLSLTPSLTFLTIVCRNSPCLSLFNGNTWHQLIENRLVRLRTLEICLSYKVSGTSTNPSLHSILASFKTPFWLSEKRWFVFSEYHLSLSEITLYTIPRYINDFERIIRCDTLSFNNSYSILVRHWTKHSEYTYTEEILTKLDLSGTMITDAGAQYLVDALENNATLTELIMQQNQMTTEATKSLVTALGKNKTLTRIFIEHNEMSEDAVQSLVNALKHNRTITTLGLRYDQIGPLQSEYFEDLLRENTVLIDFDIERNQLGDQGAQSIGNAIHANKTLKTLNLGENQISGLGTKFLAEGLKNNTTLITLDLHGNMIEDQGAQNLADALQKNQTLTTLNLAYNQIGMSGMEYLTNALQQSTMLSTLNLEGNNIERATVKFIANMLSNNTTLTTLILSNNQIWPEETKCLADALERNTTLKTLDLRTNHIGSLGLRYLSNALEKNRSLTTLNLRRNGIDSSAGQYLANLLRNNTTLITLILQNNEIGDQGTEYLAKALAENANLRTLNLAQNNIGTDGVEHIIVALQKNQTITMLNMQQKNLIYKSMMDLIDELLDRNKKLLKQNL